MENLINTTKRFLILSVIFLTSYVSTTAQDTDFLALSLEELMDVEIVTAARRPQKVSEAPATAVVVTAEQIRTRGYRSLLDVLRDLPDFQVDMAATQEVLHNVSIRGAYGNFSEKFTLLLDGNSIASPTNESKTILENYPVHFARQIEIVYGPASALYGADALSGVINIISRTAEDIDGIEVSASVGRFGLTNNTFLVGTKLSEDLSLTVSGQYFYDRQPNLSEYYPKDFEGIESLKTGRFETAFGESKPQDPVSPDYENPITANAIHATLQTGDFRFSLFRNDSKVPTATARDPNNAVYNKDAFFAASVEMANAVYTKTFGALTSTSTVLASRYSLDPQSGFRDLFTGMEKGYHYSFGSMAKAEQQMAWDITDNLSLISGITREVFDSIPRGADLTEPVDETKNISGKLLGTDIDADFFILKYANTGGYLQVQYVPTSRMALTLGARYDYNSRFGGTFNPRLGVVLQPREGTTIKALYGTAFLAPSPYQAFQHFGSFFSEDGGQTYKSDFWHLPNPDLSPQEVQTVELGLRQSIGRRVGVSLTGFYSKFSDLILIQGFSDDDFTKRYNGVYKGWPVDFIEVPINQGKQINYGGTLQFNYTQKLGENRKVVAYTSVSFAAGKIDDPEFEEKIELGNIVPIHARVGGELYMGRLSIAPRLIVVGTQRAFGEKTIHNGLDDQGNPKFKPIDKRETIDGYTLLNLSVRYDPLIEGISLWTNVENALDTRYRNINAGAYRSEWEFDGTPQHPLRIISGVEYRF